MSLRCRLYHRGVTVASIFVATLLLAAGLLITLARKLLLSTTLRAAAQKTEELMPFLRFLVHFSNFAQVRSVLATPHWKVPGMEKKKNQGDYEANKDSVKTKKYYNHY